MPNPSRRFTLGTLALTSWLAGCSAEPTATISGTVQLDGQPLPAGTVLFEQHGQVGVGTIAAGKYRLESEIPTGNYAVSILPPPRETVADPQTTELRAVNPIDDHLYPEHYRWAATSGLQFTVQPGENVYDVKLTAVDPNDTPRSP